MYAIEKIGYFAGGAILVLLIGLYLYITGGGENTAQPTHRFQVEIGQNGYEFYDGQRHIGTIYFNQCEQIDTMLTFQPQKH